MRRSTMMQAVDELRTLVEVLDSFLDEHQEDLISDKVIDEQCAPHFTYFEEQLEELINND